MLFKIGMTVSRDKINLLPNTIFLPLQFLKLDMDIKVWMRKPRN